MDNTLSRKLKGLIIFSFGILIGVISDPIENAGSDLMYAILALVISIVLPLWFILIARINRLFTKKKMQHILLNKITLTWIALGVFMGRLFLLGGSGTRMDSAFILASPFLGVFVGTLVAVLYERRSGGAS